MRPQRIYFSIFIYIYRYIYIIARACNQELIAIGDMQPEIMWFEKQPGTVATDEFADGINVRDLVNIDSIHCPSGKIGDWSRSLYKNLPFNLEPTYWLVVLNSFIFHFFHILGIIIPPDFHMFQDGWNHQPDLALASWAVGCWFHGPCHRLDGRLLRNSGWRVQVCCHNKPLSTIQNHAITYN